MHKLPTFAKPHEKMSLPRLEEFNGSFPARVRLAQTEEELRCIGGDVREYIDQGIITGMEASSFWARIQERGEILKSLAQCADTVRRNLIEHTDVLREVWKGQELPSHEGRPVTREKIPSSCHACIDSLAEMMRERLVQQVKIGPTLFQVGGARTWTFIPHVVPVTNSSSHHGTPGITY